ncbi:MAG TPA: hypothetical protein DDY82_01785 [Clostridiales bacterium]|nr:hypothetical protein [Clostridiales bacterium]HBJ97786.1 hypothetical protein [Clostridiales bacterium]
MTENLPDKFSSTEELVKAYKLLEKEFTKRCKIIKELSKSNAEKEQAVSKEIQLENSPSEVQDAKTQKENFDEAEIKDETEIKTETFIPSVKLISGGQAVRTPPKKPTSLSEAGELAKKFLIGD